MFSQEIMNEVAELESRYPERKSALIPLLHLIQREKGWISTESMDWVAEHLDLSPVHVQGVTTFYTMFNTKPVGKYFLQLCRTLSCELRGSREIRAHISKRLGIESGETTADGLFSLLEVECLGACGTAPAMMINNDYYENLSIERIDEILTQLGAGVSEASTEEG
jgi:NADH-quinone oxidoreductase E subunit